MTTVLLYNSYCRLPPLAQLLRPLLTLLPRRLVEGPFDGFRRVLELPASFPHRRQQVGLDVRQVVEGRPALDVGAVDRDGSILVDHHFPLAAPLLCESRKQLF